MGRTGGFDVYENTLLPSHTTGTLAGSPILDGANQGTSATTNVWASGVTVSVSGATSATTLKAGDIITLSGVNNICAFPRKRGSNNSVNSGEPSQEAILSEAA